VMEDVGVLSLVDVGRQISTVHPAGLHGTNGVLLFPTGVLEVVVWAMLLA